MVVVHAGRSSWYKTRKFLLTLFMERIWTYRLNIEQFLNGKAGNIHSLFWHIMKRCVHLCRTRANVKKLDQLNIYFTNSVHAKFFVFYSKNKFRLWLMLLITLFPGWVGILTPCWFFNINILLHNCLTVHYTRMCSYALLTFKGPQINDHMTLNDLR